MKLAVRPFVAWVSCVGLGVATGGRQVASNLMPRTYTTSVSPDGLHTASVLRAASIDPPDDHLFLETRGGPKRPLMDLAPDADWCRAIVWTPDSRKVGFVIADDRLAVFDVATGALDAFFFLAGTGCCGGPLESRNVAFNDDGTEVSFDRFERTTVLIGRPGEQQFEAHVTRESPAGSLESKWPMLRPSKNLGREVIRVPVSRIRLRLVAPPGGVIPPRIVVAVVAPNERRRIDVVGTTAADGLVVLPAVLDGPIDRLEINFRNGTGNRTVVRDVRAGEMETLVAVPEAPPAQPLR